MPAITASLVNDLRAKTGLGMMECKKLLSENDGDINKAIDAARKKGVKTSITERTATEGRVMVATNPDRKVAALVEVNCNTDFTAKSDTVLGILDKAVAQLLNNPGADLKNDAQIKESLTSIAQQTGENVQLGRVAVVKGEEVGSYLYSTAGKGKIGVLMQFGGTASEEIIRQTGMHIAAARPVALTRDQVPQELLAKEREIAIEQAKATGKPQNIAEKIAEGKLNSFFAERVLLDQDFINAEAYKGKVGEMLKKGGVTLVKFERIEVGQ
jgi:elongation factor Ts